MRRDDALYTWVVEVRHNPAAIPGGGSCIFLHVWDGPADTTVGCTAMPEPTLANECVDHILDVIGDHSVPPTGR